MTIFSSKILFQEMTLEELKEKQELVKKLKSELKNEDHFSTISESFADF